MSVRPVAPAEARVVATWRAQPGALMLLGRVAGPIPRVGSVRLAATPGSLGVFRAELWPLPAEPDHAFLAAVRLSARADPADHTELALRGARSGDGEFRLRLPPASSEQEFGRQAAAAASLHAARLARFMLDVMRPDEGSDAHRAKVVLGTFLAHAARADGCVELMLHLPDRCVLLQGWGVRVSDPVDVLLPGPGLATYTAQSGHFPRHDVAIPSTGSVLALPAAAASAMPGLDKVFLLTGDQLLCRSVVEPRLLDVAASIGQIRHLVPRLTCTPPLEALLRQALLPDYEGRDTLNGGTRPVRAALDIAAAADGAGAYLSGWVFDPAGHITSLHLCAEGIAVPLHDQWIRVPRPDVSTTFRADPAFPAPSCHDSGFAVATSAALRPGAPAHLRFIFNDGDLAYLPARLADLSVPGVRTALLGSVDLHKPSGVPIVERHLAPLIARMPALALESGRIMLRGATARPRAIVAPLRAATLPRALISGFLFDPPGEDEQLVFVCGPEWDAAALRTLVDLLRFYELPASIVLLPETARPATAVLHAAAHTMAETFLLVSPALGGLQPGWRDLLHRAATGGAAACPTVLFEDRSIRFAGPTEVELSADAPFATVRAPVAGLPSSMAPSSPPGPLGAGTLACCLIGRAALPALERIAPFPTDTRQEAAFFVALRQAGLAGRWAPQVAVSVPEDLDASSPVAALLGGWLLRHISEESAPCAS